MFKFFKTFFKLSNTELKGALLLLFFILLVFVAPRVYFYLQKPETIEDLEFLAWANEQNQIDSLAKLKNDFPSSETMSYFKFDPNTVSLEEMKALGIDEKTARILEKFRGKGAKFYSKKDLLKVYGFNEEMYAKLENYIQFPQKSKTKIKQNNSSKKFEVEYFVFDPNTVSVDEMKRLGIPLKTARILEKFRNKGAQFYSKEDVMKVYGFDEKLYVQLEDYIIFPEETKEEPKEDLAIKEEEIPVLYIVDVNSADTADFIKLKGIGKFYAKTIIEHRTKLGGFYDVHQLKEAYGISEELYNNLENNFVIENKSIRRININTATFKELIRHPYINKELTIEILNLRDDIGGFLKIEDLISYNVLSDKEFSRLKHYLSVE